MLALDKLSPSFCLKLSELTATNIYITRAGKPFAMHKLLHGILILRGQKVIKSLRFHVHKSRMAEDWNYFTIVAYFNGLKEFLESVLKRTGVAAWTGNTVAFDSLSYLQAPNFWP